MGLGGQPDVALAALGSAVPLAVFCILEGGVKKRALAGIDEMVSTAPKTRWPPASSLLPVGTVIGYGHFVMGHGCHETVGDGRMAADDSQRPSAEGY